MLLLTAAAVVDSTAEKFRPSGHSETGEAAEGRSTTFAGGPARRILFSKVAEEKVASSPTPTPREATRGLRSSKIPPTTNSVGLRPSSPHCGEVDGFGGQTADGRHSNALTSLPF